LQLQNKKLFIFIIYLMNNPRKNDYNHIKLHVAIVLSAVAALFSVASFFFGWASESQIFNALSKMEAFKAGGTDNRAKLQTLYTSEAFKSKQGESIDAAIAQMGGTPAPTDTKNPTTAPSTSNTLTSEQVSNVLKDNYINGNADSDIVLIEYSDFECPFCQKHFENGTVKSLVTNKNIGTIYKQFPLNFHPLAQKAAEGNICVGTALGNDKFFAYVDETFKSKNPTIDTITKIAVDLWMKESEFKKCLDSSESAGKVSADMQEWQKLFGVNGTPGNVLLNKKTGKFVVVSGAQPVSAFEQAITQIQ